LLVDSHLLEAIGRTRLHVQGERVIAMAKQPAYEEALALATTLPLDQLAQLVVALSELLRKRYATWTTLQGVDEVRDYLEWTRFCDSHYADGRRKNPQEFLAEVGEEE
jgi:hypothetical protein